MRKRRDFRLPQAAVEPDVDAEIASHIAHRTDHFIRAGETPERARELALERFGDVDRARHELYASAQERKRSVNRTEGFRAIGRDARLVWRQARRSPGGTVLTLLTLAIAIGLSTAMFAIVDHVLLRPLPYAQADRLVFFESLDSALTPVGYVSSDNWIDVKGRNSTLASSAIYREFDTAVSTEEGALRVPLQLTSPQFFDVLQAPMVRGRGYNDADVSNGSRVAVVSESFWRRHLSGSRSGSGQIRLQGAVYDVVGVIRTGSEFPHYAQVWIPSAPQFVGGAARNNVSYQAIARLQPGVTLERAQADVSAVMRAIQESEPESRYTHGVAMHPLQSFQTSDVAGYLHMLMGAVTFLLLVACANIAGVNFARARSRMQEVALRMALGAGRARVMVQLITEQVMIALAGGVLGVVLALVAVKWVSTHAADMLPRAGSITIDARVLLFAFAVALVAGIVASIFPTWRAANAAPRELLGARGVTGGGPRTSGSIVVAIEVAAAVLLLTGGALLLRSFRSVLSHELGFDPDRVVTARVILDTPDYTSPETVPLFWQELADRTRAIPGVASFSFSAVIPTGTAGPGFVDVEGRADRDASAGYRVVDERYFSTLKIRVRDGRTFGGDDRPGINRGVVVNRSMASKFWPGVSPLGKRVRSLSHEGFGGAVPQWLTVIGVVDDVRQFGYEAAPEPEMYVWTRDLPPRRALYLAVRTTPGSEAAVKTAITTTLRNMDAGLAPEIATLDERLGGMLAQRRLVLSVLTAFGLIALVLSAIGIYALMSFAVGQRTREIGVRMALGSQESEIASLILGGVARVVAGGAVVGMVASLGLTRLLESLLVDVSHTDALSYGGTLVVIACAALAAAAVPVHRALRVNPVTALRAD